MINKLLKNKLLLLAILGIGIVVLVRKLKSDQGHTGPPTISLETTRLLEPVDSDGYVDYFAASNQVASALVAPDENAAVDLIRAVGDYKGVWALLTEEVAQGDKSKFATPDGPFFQPAKMPDPGDRLKIKQFTDEIDAVKCLPWKSNSVPTADEWVENNEKPLQHLANAVRKEKCWFPEVPYEGHPDQERPGLFSSDYSKLVVIRNLSSCLLTRAMRSLGDLEIEACQDDIICCRKLGRVLTFGGSQLEQLVGCGIEATAIEAEISMLKFGRLSDDQLKRYDDLLSKLPQPLPLARSIDTAVRINALAGIQYVYRTGRLGDVVGSDEFYEPKSFDLDVMLRQANVDFDRLKELAENPDDIRLKQWYASKLFSIGKANVVFGGLINGRKGRTTALARSLVPRFMPSFDHLRNTTVTNEVQLDMIRLAIAILRFEIAHGGCPSKISELIPEFLDAEPVDKFAPQQSLGYVSPTPMVKANVRGTSRFRLDSVGPRKEDSLDDVSVLLGPEETKYPLKKLGTEEMLHEPVDLPIR